MELKQAANPDSCIHINPEKLVYARVIEKGLQGAVCLIILALTLYISGLLPATVPPSRLPSLWNLRTDDYLAATGAPTGWAWMKTLSHGDSLVMLGTAILALLVLSGYAVLAFAYWKKRWMPFFIIVVAEILVVAGSASGLLHGGGH